MLPDPTDGQDMARSEGERLSDRKLAANRANARKSTGPRTPEGKARSSMNALKYVDPPADAGAEIDQQAELLAALEADSRVERIQRMPVTEDKPLSASDRRITLENIRGYVLNKKLLSIKQLARMADVSSSVVSEVLRDKYRGDVDTVLRKLDAAIADHARRSDAPESAQFVKTSIASQIFGILKLTSKTRSMAAFYGYSGCGKTMALKAALGLDFQSAIYIESSPETNSPLRLLQAIVEQLRIRGLSPRQQRDKSELFKLVRERLVGTGRMIIIDEADNLTPRSFNLLRQLHDATAGMTDNPCPIVLAGRPPLADAIKATTRCREIGGSLVGRISINRSVVPKSGGNPADGGTWLFSVEEVMQMLARRRVKITRDAARWLCCLANLSLLTHEIEYGGLRLAIKVAVNAAALNKSDGAVGLDMVQRAYRYLVDRDDALRMEEMINGALKYAPATVAATA